MFLRRHVLAARVVVPFVAEHKNAKDPAYGKIGDYLVQEENGDQWVLDAKEFANKYTR